MRGHYTCTCLHPRSFGLAAGIIWGLTVFIIGLFAMHGYGDSFVRVMGSIYVGYGPTFWGSVAGFIWGFVKLFIGGYLVALLYNYFSCKACAGEEDTKAKK